MYKRQVIATGKSASVREFCSLAFREAGIGLAWEGRGANEKGLDAASGKLLVEVDPRYFRPTEVDCLTGDASKARAVLGWRPRVALPELVRMMVQADLKEAARERICLQEGGGEYGSEQ